MHIFQNNVNLLRPHVKGIANIKVNFTFSLYPLFKISKTLEASDGSPPPGPPDHTQYVQSSPTGA